MRRGNRRGDGRHGSVWAPVVVALAALALCGTAVATSAQSPDATSGAGSGTPDATLSADAAANLDAIIADELGGGAVADSLQAYWASTFPTFSSEAYHDPAGGFFPYHTGEGSGGACAEAAGDAAQNAAYCGTDESITYDVDWLGTLYRDSGAAGPITVLAHEWGHHIQHLAGEPNVSKSAELQADCYAGMYLRNLADIGTLGPNDVTDSLAVTYSLGDDPSSPGTQVNWTDPDVHGTANERRQAEGIGYSTAAGDYCVAYADWQDQPAAPLFGDKTIRLEPFADPTRSVDGSFSFTLPDARVELWQATFAAGASASTELKAAIEAKVPDAATWDIAAPQDGWLETLGWGTGSGATTTFSGTLADGSVEAGAAALQIDPTGQAQLYVSIGADTTAADNAIGQAQDALDALSWGYCDPEAEVTTNCPAG